MTAPGSMRAPSAEAFGFAYRYEPAVPGEAGSDLTILALHGTGGDEHDLVPLARALAPGAAVLSPRGQVLENGAPRFFRRLREGVFDLEDLARRTASLGEFVDGATAQHGLARDRVVAVGFSNGANVAASLLLRRPGSLAGALLLRAMVPFEPETPHALPPGMKAPVVTIAAGLMDPLVSREQAERLATLLRDAGADATLEWLPAGHQLTQRDLAIGQALVARL
ncbi:alpha/beta hydrolase [Roseisolibacter agri]|nr:alpha/beta hydrolase [Roseisolibacter agri]